MSKLEQTLAKYEKEMKKLYDLYVNGEVEKYEIRDKRYEIIDSLFPELGKERSQFVKKISSIDEKLEEEADSQILNRTLPPNEVQRIKKIYEEQKSFIKKLEEIKDNTSIEELETDICPFALAKIKSEPKILCAHHGGSVECNIVVPMRRGISLLFAFDAPPANEYYECEKKGGEVIYKPWGIWNPTRFDRWEERINLLRKNQKPREELTPIAVACLRLPYYKQISIKDIPASFNEQLKDLDAKDKLTYINLLSLSSVIDLLREAYVRKR